MYIVAPVRTWVKNIGYIYLIKRNVLEGTNAVRKIISNLSKYLVHVEDEVKLADVLKTFVETFYADLEQIMQALSKVL